MPENHYHLVSHTGQVYNFGQGGLTIGRQRSNQVVISDKSVSRQHARVLVAAGKCWIRDENSGTGTFVNDQRVQGQQELRSGDVLRIGNTNFRLEVAAAAASAGTPLRTKQFMVVGVGLVLILGMFFVLSPGGRRPPVPGGSPGSPGVSTSGDTAASASMPAGRAAELNLSDGAQVVIADGALNPGSNITIEKVTDTQWDDAPSSDLQTGPVYEIEAEQWGGEFEAEISLPIDTVNLSGDQLQELSLAYFSDGNWVMIPSSINETEEVITGTVNHLTGFTFIRRAFNKPPRVTVKTTPPIYAGARVEDLMDVNLDDLAVEIFVEDPEGDPVKVYVAFAFTTLETWAVDEMNSLRSHLGDHMLTELILISPEMGMLGAHVRESLAPPPTSAAIHTDWYELDEIRNGHYAIGFNLSALDLRSPLDEVEIFVRVTDKVEKAPVEIPVVVDVTADKVPGPPELGLPGPNYVCPPQPEFNWMFVSANHGFDLQSFNFRLVKGDDVWHGWFPKYDWICRDSVDCSGGGSPDSFYAQKWTPPEPLSEGRYTWGIAASGDDRERKFEPPHASRSNAFSFTVDKSLSGNQCVESLTPTPTLTFTATDTPRVTDTPHPTSTFTPRPPTNTPRPSNTPKPEKATIYLTQPSRCRTGNSKDFPDAWFFDAGTTLEIIGTDGNGWYKIKINDPKTSKTECWRGTGNVRGSVSSIPVVKTPPPQLRNLSNVSVNSREIVISVWDNASIDGDRIRLTLNNTVLLGDYTLTGSPYKIPVTLNAGANTLIVTALNVGSQSPNTVTVKISNVTSGSSEQTAAGLLAGASQMIITAP